MMGRRRMKAEGDRELNTKTLRKRGETMKLLRFTWCLCCFKNECRNVISIILDLFDLICSHGVLVLVVVRVGCVATSGVKCLWYGPNGKSALQWRDGDGLNRCEAALALFLALWSLATLSCSHCRNWTLFSVMLRFDKTLINGMCFWLL